MACGLFSHYAPLIRKSPPGRLARTELLDSRFLLARDGAVTIHYVPFERLNPNALAVLVAITPAFTQMALAYETARDGLNAGLPHVEVLDRVARQRASRERCASTSTGCSINLGFHTC